MMLQAAPAELPGNVAAAAAAVDAADVAADATLSLCTAARHHNLDCNHHYRSGPATREHS